MNTRTISLAAVFLVPFFACAQAPDLTSSLEFIANPQMDRWPNTPNARGVLDLQFYQGLLFQGAGETETNPGAPWIHSIDPYHATYDFEFDPGTEAIANYRITSWGDLLTSAQDPHEGDANQGHFFSRDAAGKWTVFKSVGGSTKVGADSSVLNNTHCWDFEEFDGRIFVSCYNLLSSTDRMKTFTVLAPITNTDSVVYSKQKYTNSKGKTSVSYYTYTRLRRQMHLLRFADELYAIANTTAYPQYMNDTGNVNLMEIFHYDKTTKQFVLTRQRTKTIYPDLTVSDFQLALDATEYNTLAQSENNSKLIRLWHTTPFKGRVLYVGSVDSNGNYVNTSYPLPLMGCSATVDSQKQIVATRISFGGDKQNYPWDYAVVGDTVYALTSKYDATTKQNHHIIWKSTDGISFAEVCSVDFHQNFISLDYRDGWFFLGCGNKTATLGCAYDSQANESGAIYRVRCPQEPVQVIASADELTIPEGESRKVSFRLSCAPATNMTLRVGATRENTRFTTDKATLTFTPDNWSTPQDVTISLDDNDVLDIDRRGVVCCGVAGFDVARGEFCGPEATAGVIRLVIGDSEFVPPPNGEIRTTDDFYCAMAFPDGTYRLMNDLDLTGSCFSPIDTFSGSFDGCGHTLKGLGNGPLCKVNRGTFSNLTLDGEGTRVKCIGAGVFCHEFAGGALTNVTMKGYSVMAGAPDTIFGLFAAQITGRAEFVGCSVADDCSVSQAGSHDCSIGAFAGKLSCAAPSGVVAAFIDCTNNASVAASDNYRTASGAGGLVGFVTGVSAASQPEVRFVRCVNNGPITGKARYNVLGGLVGRFNGAGSNKSTVLASFTDCLNAASVVHSGDGKAGGAAGGLAGIVGSGANAVVANSVNRGDISCPTVLSAGGLIGEFGNPSPIGANGITVRNSANYGTLSATNNVGGLIGKSTGSTGTGWKNGHWQFLNSANYGSFDETSVRTNAQLVALLSCEASAETVSVVVSNCWTMSDRLFGSVSRTPVAAGNQTAATPNASALASLNAVAAANPEFLTWYIGPTGRPELFGTSSEAYDPTEPPQGHEHAWGAWTTNAVPTCVAEGQLVRFCVDDGCSVPVASETQALAPLGHLAVTDPAVAPTAGETGLTEGSHCSRCGTVLVAQKVVPATGVDGPTVYVSTAGSDSATGTFVDPLLTVSNAVARLGSAGGTVVIGAGVFATRDPVVITTPVALVGAGTGADGTILRNVGAYANSHQNCRVLEVSNKVARVDSLRVENGYAGVYKDANGGGGILLWAGTVTNSVISGCAAHQGSTSMPFGGGVYVHGADAVLTHCVVTNCTSDFDAGNWGSICGGGIHVAGGKVSNTLVVDCRVGKTAPAAERIVGGILLTEGTAENCTVVNCQGSKAGGICAMPASKKTVSVVNCVAYGCVKRLKDADGVVQTTESNGEGTASCFANCAFDVSAADFADYARGDYTPKAGGALVDAGAAVEAPSGDLAGHARVYGVAIDIGCYEAQGAEPQAEAVVLTDAETQAGAVAVPYAWLTAKGFDCSTPAKAKAAALQRGANGYTVWGSYVADLDPSDPESQLRATVAVDAAGHVTVDCSPKSAARVYRVLGKESLSDAAWTPRSDVHRFFKVVVSLP